MASTPKSNQDLLASLLTDWATSLAASGPSEGGGKRYKPNGNTAEAFASLPPLDESSTTAAHAITRSVLAIAQFAGVPSISSLSTTSSSIGRTLTQSALECEPPAWKEAFTNEFPLGPGWRKFAEFMKSNRLR